MRVDLPCFSAPSHDAIPRPLVIDGCNIGRSASGFARTHVDCAGLVAVIRWLMSKNFDVIVFLPVVYNNINNYNARNAELLHKLERLGIVTFTPARSGRGMRKAFINYDDLYVVSYASRHGGCILSGDKFKDILQQSCYSDFHEVIRYRTVDIRFRPLALDFVRYEKDLFYKQVPELYIYENLHLKNEMLRRKLYVSPNDSDYHQVRSHRLLLTPERRAFLCAELDSLMIVISLAAGKAFRDTKKLPFTDILPTTDDLRIEDIMTAELCEQFYKVYPKSCSNNEQNMQLIMDPVMDVTELEPRKLSVVNEKSVAKSEEVLIDLSENDVENKQLEGTSMLKSIENKNKTSDDCVLIDLKASENTNKPSSMPSLPKDLSCSALLKWFTMAENKK